MIKEWLVIYNKTEIVEEFRCSLAAHAFVHSNNKDYFYDIEVLTREVYEWRMEELAEQSAKESGKASQDV